MGEYRYRENVKRGMAFVLAIILGGMAFLPGFPVFPAKAAPARGQQTTLTTAHGDTLLGHKLYCIDKGGYAIWGIAEKGDLYEAHRPSQASVPLSSQLHSIYNVYKCISPQTFMCHQIDNTVICSHSPKLRPIADRQMQRRNIANGTKMIFAGSCYSRLPCTVLPIIGRTGMTLH